MMLFRSALAFFFYAIIGSSAFGQIEETPSAKPAPGIESAEPTAGSPPPGSGLSAEDQARIEREAQAAATGCAACGTGLIAAVIVTIALNIALMVFVARDAKSRGMDSAVLWMFLVMGTGLIGLLIYMLSRPQGALAICQTCGGKRLAVSAICPHCRNP
jgi:hypothetical protein